MANAPALQAAYPTPILPSGAVAVERLGLVDLWRTYRRHLWLFLAVASGVMALAAAYTFLQVPRYTATATLVVAPRPADIGSDRTTPLSDPATDASVDTQVELLKSRALAAAVVARLRLDDPARFAGFVETRRWRVGLPGLGHAAKPAPTAAGRTDMAIDRLQQGLEVHRTAQTFALTLGFTHPDRRLAMALVNAVAGRFVVQSRDTKRAGADDAGALLGRQLDRAGREVKAADEALGRYRVAHNLMSVQGGTIAEQQMSTLDQQVADARAGEAEAAARLDTARRQLAGGSSGDTLGEALSSPVVQQLRTQRATLSAQVANLSGFYGDRYPPLAAARRQLADIDRQIQGEIDRTLASLRSQREVAARRVSSLSGSAGAARAAVVGNNVAAIALGGLQLRSDTAHTNYAALLARVNEVGAQAATTQPDARIDSPAALPVKPSAPNRPINLLVGALLAISAGLAAVFVRQGTDQGLRTLEDVEGRLHLPYLAGLPTLGSAVRQAGGSDPVAALLDHRQSAFAEGYRSLAAAVLDGEGDEPIRIVAITSALPAEGKTTAAIGLARIIAMDGRSVVLVDADMRRPSIADAMGLRPAVGLQQVLNGEASLDEALHHDAESGAFILPMLRAGKVSAAALASPAFDALIAQLTARFGLVLLDASPVLPVVDGRLVAKKADATVLLARWRETPDAAVEMAAHMLAALGVRMKGVALTRIDLNELSRSGYGDPAQFLGAYASYYAS